MKILIVLSEKLTTHCTEWYIKQENSSTRETGRISNLLLISYFSLEYVVFTSLSKNIDFINKEKDNKRNDNKCSKRNVQSESLHLTCAYLSTPLGHPDEN
jgi:hypothetical protein